MKNYENNFFKIQILPRSLLLALLLAPAINNLEIFFYSFYEFLWMFTSIYEYLRVFTSIYEYFWWIFTNTLYFTWSILLELLLLAPVISNFNFFHQWALILTFFTQKWLCYRMFGLGGNRIFIISTYRWVTRIFMTLHDQNGRWNTTFMNIKVFKNHDAPNFWWFSVIFIIIFCVVMNRRGKRITKIRKIMYINFLVSRACVKMKFFFIKSMFFIYPGWIT